MHQIELTTDQLRRLIGALYVVDGTADIYQELREVAVTDGVMAPPPIPMARYIPQVSERLSEIGIDRSKVVLR